MDILTPYYQTLLNHKKNKLSCQTQFQRIPLFIDLK